MDAGVIVLLSVVAWVVVFTFLGSWVSCQKHRRPEEGAILGLLFGPFGVLLEALLPTLQPAPPPSPPQGPTGKELRAMREEAEREREVLTTRQLKEAAESLRLSREQRAYRARRRRERWEATPDWLKMVLAGLGVGALVCVPIIVAGALGAFGN